MRVGAIAWATALLSMRGARTADDVRHDTRAFEAVLNNLVHVAQQQEKDRKLGEQYDEKKVELEADAKKASQRTLRPWEDEYQDLMFQNGFAGKSKPSPMDPMPKSAFISPSVSKTTTAPDPRRWGAPAAINDASPRTSEPPMATAAPRRSPGWASWAWSLPMNS